MGRDTGNVFRDVTTPLAPARQGRAERLRDTAAGFTRISLSVFPVLVLLRAYEHALGRSAHVLPDGVAVITLWGIASDLLFTLSLAGVLAIPLLAIAQRRAALARVIHRVLLVLVVLASIALIQYFAVTFVPLGADLFGYSWSDITKTTASGTGFGLASLLPFAIFGVLTWYASGLGSRLRTTRGTVLGFFAAIVAAGLFRGTLHPRQGAFASDAAYFLAENKLAFFASRSLGYAWGRLSRHEPLGTLTGYPLLRPASYEDVLGPHLNLGVERPNLVFVSIEGLGRDFVGAGARFGGFMPFLDSLANRSLYWENFLSTSGRTFGMLPSLLGSLPFADAGFMQLGSRMPHHQTLLSLLKERGYATSYFTGTYGNWELIDVFMERQKVDRFVDQSRFGSRFQKQPAGEGNFSWGYGDLDLFRRSFELMGSASEIPRLDVYSTTTMHEPFVPPRTAEYLAEFERRLGLMHLEPDRRAAYRKYSSIFATLIYTDDALRFFFGEYSRRDDYSRTIFFITGDHRLVPIPEVTRIDRFHVPFWIVSDMVKTPRRFSSVSSHLDVAPSVIALLKYNYDMPFPDSVHWLGTGIDTSQRFRSLRSLALMRTKNQLDAYLDGVHFLSHDQLFRLDDGFRLRSLDSSEVLADVRTKLDRFRQVNRYVTSSGRLYPGGVAAAADLTEATRDDSLFLSLGLHRKTPTESFVVARQLAVKGEYESGRRIARRVLRESPNFHDARTLLGRAYGWEGRYDEARAILEALARRAPEYIDGRAALIDVELWSGNAAKAVVLSDSALRAFPRDGEILLRKARALEILGRERDALTVLDTLLAADPSNADAVRIRDRLRP